MIIMYFKMTSSCCTKTQEKPHTQKSQEASPMSAGDHKAAMNRQNSMADKLHKGPTKQAPPKKGQ